MNILQVRKCLGALGLVIVFGVVTAFGCNCIKLEEPLQDTITNAFNYASVVFTGKVVALEYQKGIANAHHEEFFGSKGFETQVVKFEVAGWWKTALPSIFYLATDLTRGADGTGSSSSCDYGFQIGKSYMVYASGKGRETRNITCSRTRQLNRAQDDLNLLGPGKKPRDDSK